MICVVAVWMHPTVIFHGGPDDILQSIFHSFYALTFLRFEREEIKWDDEGQFDGCVNVTGLCAAVMDHGDVAAEQRKRGGDWHQVFDEIVREGGR